MIHLMKLELKKVGLKRYFLFSMLGIFLCMFFVFTGLNDKSTSIYDYDVTFRTISLFFCFYYIILFAVLNVAYIINEYTNKTILILFSYPLDRKKLILSKLLLITTLMISSMIVGYICCFTFVVGMIRKSIPVTLVSSIIFINLRQFILAGTNTTQDSLISVFIIVGITVIGIYYILNHKVTEID
ncbi:TPA: ABC transporter permease [Clostridioides difficile]|nr:ABC transporter permease [Clostridioides difficile]